MKKILICCLSLLLVAVTATPVQAQENVNISLYDDYAIVIDNETGIVLGGKNADERMYPASITKVVTVAVSLPLIEDLDETTVITANDLATIYANGASAAYFQVDETVSYRDLVLGALIPSGADACRALAFNLFGSQEAMVAEMNKLVESLGLQNTHFTNNIGLHDEEHYTTAYDMAQLVRYACSVEGFEELFNVNKATSTSGLHTWYKKVVYNARNSGLSTENLLGCKSGYTYEAQSTLASLMNANGRKVVVVVAHSKHAPEQYSTCMYDTIKLTDYVNSNSADYEVVASGQTVGEIEVIDGIEDTIPAVTNESLTLFLPNDYQSRIQLNYEPVSLEAPIMENQQAGKLEVSYDGTVMAVLDVSTANAVERDHIAYFIRYPIRLLFPYVTAIALMIIFILLMLLKIKLNQESTKIKH